MLKKLTSVTPHSLRLPTGFKISPFFCTVRFENRSDIKQGHFVLMTFWCAVDTMKLIWNSREPSFRRRKTMLELRYLNQVISADGLRPRQNKDWRGQEQSKTHQCQKGQNFYAALQFLS